MAELIDLRYVSCIITTYSVDFGTTITKLIWAKFELRM